MQFYDQQHVAKTNVIRFSLMADRDHGLKSFYPDRASNAALHAPFCSRHTGSGTLMQQSPMTGVVQIHTPQIVPQHFVSRQDTQTTCQKSDQ